MEEKNKQLTFLFQEKKNKINIKKIDYISLQKKILSKQNPVKKENVILFMKRSN